MRWTMRRAIARLKAYASPILRRLRFLTGAQEQSVGPQLRMVRKFEPGEQSEGPKLCPGYRVERYVPGDEDRWVSLINASGDFRTWGAWNREILSKEILSGLLPNGGVFAVAGDTLVGCAAVCHWERFHPYAVLMYVVVVPEHRGRGLGTMLTAEAVQVARRLGCPGVILHTDDDRLAAIKTYLRLAFVPDIDAQPCTKARWKRILRLLSVPSMKG